MTSYRLLAEKDLS